MENYVSQTEELKRYTLENETVGVNTVEGTIDLPENKVLCLSIPYANGWHAKVDGEKTKLLRANVMYMALPLEKGEHKIELFYRTPGLYPGIGLTCAGFIVFGFFIWQGRKKRKIS